MIFAPDVLRDRAAVVTGGATGIGAHIVRLLGQLGAHVGMVSRKAEKLRQAADAFAADDGIDVRWRSADIRDDEAITGAVQELADELGGLDIMVCNAAGNFWSRTEDLSFKGWRTVIDIDLHGTFNSCQAALPHLRESPTGGRIIAISTTAAKFGWPLAAHAGAAKAGIQNLMKTLAVEWGPYGIRANWISPGPIEGTEGVERLLVQEGLAEEYRQGVPLGTFGEGIDIANAVAFLAADSGRYISGTELVVDGGSQWKP